MKIILKLLIVLILVCTSVGCSTTDKEEINTAKNTENEESVEEDINININDLFNNIDAYLGKKITVTGFAPYEVITDENGRFTNCIYDKEWINELYVNNIEEPINGGFEITITGKVYKKDNKVMIDSENYKINEEMTRDGAIMDNETNNQSLFEQFQTAGINYANMNWNQFFNNPTSLSGTFVYIPGKVVDVSYLNGFTSGLIDTVGNGNLHDMVSFSINGEVYDFNIGDIIAPMGTISPMTGSATNSYTYETVNTPLIEVSDSSLWKTEYTIDLKDDAVAKFMYGTYEAIDSNDVDENFGTTIEFTDSTIDGYKYQYQEKVYENPSIRITSGTIMRGYDDIRIGMDLYVTEVDDAYSNLGAETTSVSIELKDNTMLCNGKSYRKNK